MLWFLMSNNVNGIDKNSLRRNSPTVYNVALLIGSEPHFTLGSQLTND